MSGDRLLPGPMYPGPMLQGIVAQQPYPPQGWKQGLAQVTKRGARWC